MNLRLKGFFQLVEDMGAALQSSATNLIDISVGSVVRAIFEANASVALWVQWLLLQVLQTTRAATSNGADLDTWMMDFGLTRLPAAPSSGTVTLARLAANLSATVPAATILKTGDGSVSFIVTEDPNSSIWSPSFGYVIPAGVNAVDVPVTCTSVGSHGNVLAQAITVIASPLPGVDQVTNNAAFFNGEDAETDSAFRIRFQNYISSRSRATVAALRNAISSVRQGLNFEIQENTGADGSATPGFVTIIVDDGSGYPSASLMSAIVDAIDQVRPVATMFAVLPPTVMSVDVSVTVTHTGGAETGSLQASIQYSVTRYLNGLRIGRTASVTKIAQSCYDAELNIENVTDITLNGLSSDLTPAPRTVIKAGQIMVTISDR